MPPPLPAVAPGGCCSWCAWRSSPVVGWQCIVKPFALDSSQSVCRALPGQINTDNFPATAQPINRRQRAAKQPPLQEDAGLTTGRGAQRGRGTKHGTSKESGRTTGNTPAQSHQHDSLLASPTQELRDTQLHAQPASGSTSDQEHGSFGSQEHRHSYTEPYASIQQGKRGAEGSHPDTTADTHRPATSLLHLVSERSRMNPVYRLIRKRELKRALNIPSDAGDSSASAGSSNAHPHVASDPTQDLPLQPLAAAPLPAKQSATATPEPAVSETRNTSGSTGATSHLQLVGERSRMNHVYRLIRQTELRMKRAGGSTSGTPGVPVAAASPHGTSDATPLPGSDGLAGLQPTTLPATSKQLGIGPGTARSPAASVVPSSPRSSPASKPWSSPSAPSLPTSLLLDPAHGLRSLISLSALGPDPGSRLSFDLDPMLGYPSSMPAARSRSHHASTPQWMSHDPFTLQDHSNDIQADHRSVAPANIKAQRQSSPPIHQVPGGVLLSTASGRNAHNSRSSQPSLPPSGQHMLQGSPTPVPGWQAPAPDPWLVNKVLPTGNASVDRTIRIRQLSMLRRHKQQQAQQLQAWQQQDADQQAAGASISHPDALPEPATAAPATLPTLAETPAPAVGTGAGPAAHASSTAGMWSANQDAQHTAYQPDPQQQHWHITGGTSTTDTGTSPSPIPQPRRRGRKPGPRVASSARSAAMQPVTLSCLAAVLSGYQEDYVDTPYAVLAAASSVVGHKSSRRHGRHPQHQEEQLPAAADQGWQQAVGISMAVHSTEQHQTLYPGANTEAAQQDGHDAPLANTQLSQLVEEPQSEAEAAAARLLRLQPNLRRRDPQALSDNVAALAHILNTSRARVCDMVHRYPPLLEMAPATVEARLASLTALFQAAQQQCTDGAGSLSPELPAHEVASQVLYTCPALLARRPEVVIARLHALASALEACPVPWCPPELQPPATSAPEQQGPAGQVHMPANSAGSKQSSWASPPKPGTTTSFNDISATTSNSSDSITTGISSSHSRVPDACTRVDPRAVLLLRVGPNLIARCSSELVASKVTLLGQLAASVPAWAHELQVMKAPTLTRCLASSERVLRRLVHVRDRIEAASDAGSLQAGVGPSEAGVPTSAGNVKDASHDEALPRFGMTTLLIMSASEFARHFPDCKQ